jgi:hypothetical protein
MGQCGTEVTMDVLWLAGVIAYFGGTWLLVGLLARLRGEG